MGVRSGRTERPVGAAQPRAGHPGDQGATVPIYLDSLQHEPRPRALPGTAQPTAGQSLSRCRARWQHPPPLPATRPRACSIAGTPAPKGGRAPPPHTLREGAAGLTSLLLAEDDAALGVGERCRVTRAIAARARPGASSSRPGPPLPPSFPPSLPPASAPASARPAARRQ